MVGKFCPTKIMSLCGRCVGVVVEGHSTGKLSIIDSRQARKNLAIKEKMNLYHQELKQIKYGICCKKNLAWLKLGHCSL